MGSKIWFPNSLCGFHCITGSIKHYPEICGFNGTHTNYGPVGYRLRGIYCSMKLKLFPLKWKAIPNWNFHTYLHYTAYYLHMTISVTTLKQYLWLESNSFISIQEAKYFVERSHIFQFLSSNNTFFLSSPTFTYWKSETHPQVCQNPKLFPLILGRKRRNICPCLLIMIFFMTKV